MEKKNIFQRVNDVRKAIGYVQKDKSVSTGGGSYKAVTHDQVTALIRSHMIDAGIVCVPTLIASEMHPKEEGAKQQRYDATYSFDFVNADDPADRLTIVIESHAMDNADKAPGKALSYAKKYAVLKLFEIETGEDEESRYQADAFDVIPHIDAVLACGSMEELKDRYSASYRLAEDAKDRDAMKAIMAAKDNAKKRILEGAKQ